MRGRFVKQMFKPMILASGLAIFAGCSGSQQEDENLDATENGKEDNKAENNNLGQDDAAEGNGQENFVDNDGKADAGAQGADVNSATAATESLNSTLDAGTPPVNTAAAATPSPAPAAAAGGEGSPIAGGRVRYVKAGGV